jgi:hypothetical protein
LVCPLQEASVGFDRGQTNLTPSGDAYPLTYDSPNCFQPFYASPGLWDVHEFWSYRLFCFSSSAGQTDLTPVNANTAGSGLQRIVIISVLCIDIATTFKQHLHNLGEEISLVHPLVSCRSLLPALLRERFELPLLCTPTGSVSTVLII